MVVNQLVKYGDAQDPLSAIFAALADPTRRAMLDRLGKGEATVSELAAPFRMSLPAISRHLKVLEQAKLISRGKQAQWRPCRLEARTLKEVSEWASYYRPLWEESLDSLDSYLQRVQTGASTRLAGNDHE